MDEQNAHGKTQMAEESLWYVEKGSGTWKKCRNIVKVFGDATRKAPLELNLVGEIKDKKKSLLMHFTSKMKARENVGLLLNEVGALVMEDAEKEKLINTFFASVITAKTGP